MQAADLDMPCIKIPCPCWLDVEISSITNSNGSLSCLRTPTTTLLKNTSPVQFAIVDTSRPICRFTDTAVEPPISRRFSNITNIEAEACQTQLITACDGLGL